MREPLTGQALKNWGITGMSALLQGPHCHCFPGRERLPLRSPGVPAQRTPFRAVRHSERAQTKSRRKLHCRTVNTSEPSTSVSTSSPTYSPQQKGLPQAQIWELDFCSRPLLDERGKKRWELLICSPDRQFEYSAYFPNNKINSTQVCIVYYTSNGCMCNSRVSFGMSDAGVIILQPCS